ncbi:hypothetical protein CVT25_005033 [Psilocybe cyanescens]|uniref:Uncharacterized protein n=1 Tax=Psilocybe cyanescens TaxID=93625 RepID=A0A409XIX4_PSICY|nr:hypothetical protein CVT25_005033 [Psilocybe cyanescens]
MSQSYLNYGMSPVDERLREWLTAVPTDTTIPHTFNTHVLHIKIGPAMTVAKAESMLEDIENYIFLVPNLTWVDIIVYKDVWTSWLHRSIETRLPGPSGFRVRVVSPESYLEHSQTWDASPSASGIAFLPTPSLPSSSNAASTFSFSSPTRTLLRTSVAMALEGLNRQNLTRISQLLRITRLTIRGRHSEAWDPSPQDILRKSHCLCRFLMESREALRDLEEVTLSLDFFRSIRPILRVLQYAMSIRSVRLTLPTAFASRGLPQGIQMSDVTLAIEEGMRDFPPLKELIMPTEFVGPSNFVLVHLLEQMFIGSTYSLGGTSVMFYNGSGDDLLQSRPLLFLPARIV